MKRKSLFAMLVIATMALSACGNAEETANTNVSTSTVESSAVASSESVAEPTTDVTESSSEVASSEAPSSEAAPVVNEMSYEVSALVYPNGSASEELIDYDTFWGMWNGYNNPEILQPYYTVTNTSDSAYNIELVHEGSLPTISDWNFEPGEIIVVPAYLYPNQEATDADGKIPMNWLNLEDAVNADMGNIRTNEAKPENTNHVQEKMTITFDADNLLRDGAITLDSEMNGMVDFVIYYDESGNVISSGTASTDGGYNYFEGNTFIYPTKYYYTTQEPFTWASADVYYSYEVTE